MRSLLELLQDGSFHSGEALGAALGVSRAAVWKRLQNLQRDYGVVVHRVPGKGYRLAEPVGLLDPVLIAAETGLSGRVFAYDEIDSTNSQATRLSRENGGEALLVLAERQTQGRGRRGRSWISPFAKNLYFSLVWPLPFGLQGVDGLSLVVGLAVRDLLLAEGVSAGLKWPNDVLVAERKISGVLLELLGDPADSCQVVIGVGINVNMRDEAAIDRPWTSLRMEAGRVCDRNRLCMSFYHLLTGYLRRLTAEGFLALRDEWEHAHVWQGRDVTLSGGAQPVAGQVLGVDERGALRLLVGGREQVFSGGEISLRLQA